MPIARQLIIGKACVFGTTPLRTQHLRRSKLRPCLPGFNRTRFTQTILQEDIGNHHVQQKRHTLPDGTKLEVLEKLAGKAPSSCKPPLVMLHGSGHAAWCYKETFMPYFADRGYDTYAISFRSQGNSDRQLGVKSAGTLASHAADLDHFVKTFDRPPVIMAHSFSGLVAQRYVLGSNSTLLSAAQAKFAEIAGLILLASAPPAGNGSLVWRTLHRRPLFSIRLTWGFITRSYSRSLPLFKEMFMSDDIPEKELQRWYKLLQENMSPVQLVDLSYMNKHELPLPRPPPSFDTPVLTMLGDHDGVVDFEAAQETAQHFGQAEAVKLKGVAHDLMLDTRWQTAASTIQNWLKSEQPSKQGHGY